MGTAKNIAMACNILPASADVLELTTETFDVLESISTLKMASIQSKIQAARDRLTEERTIVSETSLGEKGDGSSCQTYGSWLCVAFAANFIQPMGDLGRYLIKMCRTDEREHQLEEEVNAIIREKTKECL